MLRRRCTYTKESNQSPHSFRRLFALTILSNGTDLFSLQLLMGHADLQALCRYLKQVSTDLQEVYMKGNPVSNINF